ncbi:uncharacterized protein LOC108161662 [Drosophila miranda]|uniref:uncharacterized protein LOC108161662 n=1 Tax=Drosophila miranda TaxID=7229 RepID=UPI0007E7C633|nr:uncharacterized protein LOC108161662 [Drosophila miranda]
MTNNFNYYYCCKHAPSHHPTPGSDEMSAPQVRAPQQVPSGGYARRMMELWTSIVETEEQQKKQELFDKGPLTVEADMRNSDASNIFARPESSEQNRCTNSIGQDHFDHSKNPAAGARSSESINGDYRYCPGPEHQQLGNGATGW